MTSEFTIRMVRTGTLQPCPFCGAGETRIHVNQGTWNGRGHGEPVSVEVRHWCSPDAGQPSRMIARAGRDQESAIAAWNRRAPTTTQEPVVHYRLLVRGQDRIQASDEFLREDGVTWRTDPSGIFVGCVYEGNILLPARRPIEAAHGIQGAIHG
ncbi:Lar family restriction alleviation protein [Acidovorax sp. sif1233]|uniref:Lar family restriction alleviation protein n=1 Tax=Acidovorax sp. sif1233 TaxID=2854792 RepID=UPI001C47C108|nr:Lar family restriction alleviation protein [Acidovorax sp. sif1233]MBV7457361.1 Lar family restriction alleviation protein [Acidovorax sp. sif1233]